VRTNETIIYIYETRSHPRRSLAALFLKRKKWSHQLLRGSELTAQRMDLRREAQVESEMFIAVNCFRNCRSLLESQHVLPLLYSEQNSRGFCTLIGAPISVNTQHPLVLESREIERERERDSLKSVHKGSEEEGRKISSH